jgi:hypothetical protein
VTSVLLDAAFSRMPTNFADGYNFLETCVRRSGILGNSRLFSYFPYWDRTDSEKRLADQESSQRRAMRQLSGHRILRHARAGRECAALRRAVRSWMVCAHARWRLVSSGTACCQHCPRTGQADANRQHHHADQAYEFHDGHPTSRVGWLDNGPSAADDADEEQHNRDHEQHVNERAYGVRAHDAEQPSNEQNYSQCHQHLFLPSALHVRVIRDAIDAKYEVQERRQFHRWSRVRMSTRLRSSTGNRARTRLRQRQESTSIAGRQKWPDALLISRNWNSC